jgi:cell division protein FtsB
MSKFEEHKKFWRIFYSPLVLIILLVVFFFVTKALWRMYQHERVSAQDRSRLESQLAAANQHEAILKNQVNALETPKGVEDEIRSKFNVTKAGEKVAVIVSGTSATSVVALPATPQSWWQMFTSLFGG